MNLKQYYNEQVKIVDTDGQTFVGRVTDYVYPEDNEPEAESIIIDTEDGEILEFFEEDIEKIEITEE